MHRHDRDPDWELGPVPPQGGDLDPLVQHRPFARLEVMGQAAPMRVPIGFGNDCLGQSLPDRLRARAAKDQFSLRVPAGNHAVRVGVDDGIQGGV